MKTFIKVLVSVIVALSFSVPSYAQLKVSAEIRPRGEFRRGYKSLILESQKDNPSVFVSQRTRLKLDYSKSFIKARINFQDVRIWGDETIYTSSGAFGKSGSIDLFEAWVQFEVFEHAFIRAGRQGWKYDDQRLLSIRNWNQRGISYDALLLGYNNSKIQIEGGFSWNNDLESLLDQPYNPRKIRTLNFLYFKNEINKNISGSLIALMNGYQKNDSSNTIYLRGTYGANAWYEDDLLKIHLSGYYQNGKNNQGNNVSAYALFTTASLNIGNWSFGPGFDLISGNDNLKSTRQDTDHMFDILYGARHGYYGYMNYFANFARSTGGSGLMDAHFYVDRAIAKKHRLEIRYHYFLLQNNYYIEVLPNQYESLDKYLASEADLVYSYNLSPSLVINAGYSVFFPTTSMEIVNGVSEGNSITGQWAWVMLTFKPVLFNSEKFIQNK